MQNKAEKSLPINSKYKHSTAPIPKNYSWIAEAAYYKALARNFIPNHEQEDWLEAKNDYETMLSKQKKNGLVSL